MFVPNRGSAGGPDTFFRDRGETGPMQTVSMERDLAAPPGEVRDAMGDVEAFMASGGFDDVTVDGDRVHLENSVGLLTIELDLALVEEPDAALAYEQREGLFAAMTTRFVLEPSASGTTVVGETEFELDRGLVGPILDATIIKRQRRKELEGHFAYLERATAE